MGMKVEKVINNNLVKSFNSKGQEILVMGCGLGFKKKPGDSIDEAMVEKVFTAQDAVQSNRLVQMLEKVPLERIQLTNEIISFALDRANEGMMFRNGLLWEIKRFYNHEYLVGKEALSMIHKRLGVELPEDEACFCTRILSIWWPLRRNPGRRSACS